MADNNIKSIEEVGAYINNYYKNPDEILDKIL